MRCQAFLFFVLILAILCSLTLSNGVEPSPAYGDEGDLDEVEEGVENGITGADLDEADIEDEGEEEDMMEDLPGGHRGKTGVPHGQVSLTIVNHAGYPIDLYWVDIRDGVEHRRVKQTVKPIRNESETHINSYENHQFLVKFYHNQTLKDVHLLFSKSAREETVMVTYDKEKDEFSIQSITRFDEIMAEIKNATEICAKGDLSKLTECVTQAVIDDIEKMADAKAELVKNRDLMSNRLRNYTCADHRMETSPPLYTYTWNPDDGGEEIQIDALYETDHAKIWVAHDFITEEECDILEKHGRPELKRATVAAEDGTSIVSIHRKAQQANYDVHHDDMENDPLYSLYYRVFAMTNSHAGYELQLDGQEDFTIIQYNPTDEYTAHCDGTCDGTKYISHGRVASAVLYCKVADKGGATTFTKSDIFVKPTNGMATFFSYKGLDGVMDDGYTEHSGCPVIEGEKWITTVWMRDGVTADEPWHFFDPDGVRMLDEDVYEEEGAGGEEAEEESEEL